MIKKNPKFCYGIKFGAPSRLKDHGVYITENQIKGLHVPQHRYTASRYNGQPCNIRNRYYQRHLTPQRFVVRTGRLSIVNTP